MKIFFTICLLILLFIPKNNLFSEIINEDNKKMILKIGDAAPDFFLPDKDGIRHKLSDYRGKWILLYFYPKDDTPGCTKEACSFRDNYTSFEKNNVKIIGVSVDSEESHVKFSEKYKLPFVLLSDSKKEVVELYGARGIITTSRMSYLINPEGKIIKIYNKVSPAEHPQEILNDLESLMK